MYIKLNNGGYLDYLSIENTNDNLVYISEIDAKKMEYGAKYQNGVIIETEEFKNKILDLEKFRLKQELETITNELVNLNGRIKGAEDLKPAGIFDEDDEVELTGYIKKQEELAIKRSEIKIKLKELL